MSITLTGTGGLFTRLGAIYRFVGQLRLQAAGTGSAGRWAYELNDLYVKVEDASNVIQQALDVIPPSMQSAVSSAEQLASSLKQAAQTILIEMADAADPLPDRTVIEALRVLITQLEIAPTTVLANTITATVTAGTNSGDGKIICSVLDGQGRVLENVLAEDVLCQRDATAQTFECRGESASDSKLSADWPRGSGSAARVDAIDASGGVSILTNGEFDDFTSNAPDDWTISVGAAGTTIFSEATIKLAGTHSLKLAGSATLIDIRQDVTAQVAERTPLAVNAFVRVDSTPAAGVMKIELFDGTSVINDDAGTANAVTVTLTGLSTSWVAFNGFFRLPDPMPAQVFLRLRMTTALTTGRSAYVDQLALIEATRLYDGGPYLAAFIGGTEFAMDDTFTIAIANNRTSLYQEAADVLWDTGENDIRLPTAASSPTITNSFPTYEGT